MAYGKFTVKALYPEFTVRVIAYSKGAQELRHHSSALSCFIQLVLVFGFAGLAV